MSVKSVATAQPQKPKYPTIKIYKSLIVLFTRHNTGTVLSGSEIHVLGYHSASWDEGYFKEYHGRITLENE